MNCRNCGNELQETYCAHCGEKKFNRNQLSLKHFAEEIFEGLIHFDSKFLRTVKMLVTKPGQLSLDYTEGIRVRFMKPIQFFVVINLLFFFLILINTYSLPLQNYMKYKPFTDYHTKEIIQNKLKHDSLTLREYEQVFNEQMNANSKEFIFLFIPFYGLIFALLFVWKRKLFVEHLVFATHFVSFVLWFFLVTTYLIELPFYLITKVQYSQKFDDFFQHFTLTFFFIYLLFAIRKFYRSPLIWSIIASGVVIYPFYLFLEYYRMLLFFKIIYLN